MLKGKLSGYKTHLYAPIPGCALPQKRLNKIRTTSEFKRERRKKMKEEINKEKLIVIITPYILATYTNSKAFG